MTNFQWQRWIFQQAIQNGWLGKEPSVLGNLDADTAFRDAEQFLLQKGILVERRNTGHAEAG